MDQQLTSSIAASTGPTSKRASITPQQEVHQVCTPPEYFGSVEQGIYRSNAPNTVNLPFLKTLRLKTMLVLSPEQPTRDVLAFLEEHGIRLFHLGSIAAASYGKAQSDSSWRPISDELIKEGLEFILNERNHPVLVCCTLGIHETGTLVGCLRRLLGWNYNSVVVEYRAFAGSRARYINEQYVELFDLDLVSLPSQNLPRWLSEYNELQQPMEKTQV